MFSDKFCRKIQSAETVSVLSGAGVSAESGVPTFRGEGGLWRSYRPEELATPEAFERDPDLVWDWYNYRRNLIAEVEPNPGHTALAALEQIIPDLTVITQNVDDLHRLAGSRNILELHGNIMQSRCVRCGVINDVEVARLPDLDPYCMCGGRLRPNVVWFGEQLSRDILWKAYAASENCDLFLCVGTSALVHPAASLPVLALDQGSYLVEINTEKTPISEKADEVIAGKSGDIIPRIVDLVRNSS